MIKSFLQRMTHDISINLLGVLFHCETEKRVAAEEKSLKLFKKECAEALIAHKYRVKRSRVEFDGAVGNYRAMSRALEHVVGVLLKNEFQITAAQLARTRFLLKLQRAGLDFEGVLSFTMGANKEVALSVYKSAAIPSTCVFKVKYSVKQGLVSTNRMIQGLLKAIE